jgi:hypothetical protein
MHIQEGYGMSFSPEVEGILSRIQNKEDWEAVRQKGNGRVTGALGSDARRPCAGNAIVLSSKANEADHTRSSLTQML